ncbi:MAG: AIR synthase related protein, partial [Spirochaetia bacterium]|nr:AIR synthase related protein [Spirochaetia bacterium]
MNLIETRLVNYIKEKSQPNEIPGIGMGDDAAFLLLSSMEESKLIVSTDSVVENVHFKREWGSYADVAIKLIERTSSDILAKGGHPHWALLNMNITGEFAKETSLHRQFVDTFCEKLRQHKISLVGGDVTRCAVNSFTMTVLGNASIFVRRKSDEIKTGDLLVIHGKIGGSSLALEVFQNGGIPEKELAAFYLRPEACWENVWLKDLDARVSMDQSDSLMETLNTIAEENMIALTIHLEKIPLSVKMQEDENTAGQILKSSEDLAILA